MIMIDHRWTNACKEKYDGKYAKIDIMAVWETVNGEVGLKQLILFENQNMGLGW